MEIRREDAALREEQKELQGLLEDTRKQWRKIAGELKETRKLFGPDTAWGKRRTELGEAAAVADRDRRRSVRRARAGDGDPLGEGLDPRAQGPRRRSRRTASSRKATRPAHRAVRDHRQAAAVRLRRPRLHARRAQAAGRARPRRADPALDRAWRHRRSGGAVRVRGRRQARRRQPRGLRLHRRRRRDAGDQARRQADPQRPRHAGGEGRSATRSR